MFNSFYYFLQYSFLLPQKRKWFFKGPHYRACGEFILNTLKMFRSTIHEAILDHIITAVKFYFSNIAIKQQL